MLCARWVIDVHGSWLLEVSKEIPNSTIAGVLGIQLFVTPRVSESRYMVTS